MASCMESKPASAFLDIASTPAKKVWRVRSLDRTLKRSLGGIVARMSVSVSVAASVLASCPFAASAADCSIANCL